MSAPTPSNVRAAASGMGPLGWAALAAAAVSLWIVFASARGLVSAVLMPGAGQETVAARGEADHGGAIASHIRQIDGRTLFFTPAAPPPEPVVVQRDDGPAGPPPPPSRYGGPALVAMINDAAWFADGRKITVGSDEHEDLKVVRLVPPWEAVLLWRDVEFKVTLFERDQIIVKQPEPARNDDPADPGDAVAGEPQDTAGHIALDGRHENAAEEHP